GGGEIVTDVVHVHDRVGTADQMFGFDGSKTFGAYARSLHVQLVRGDQNSPGRVGDEQRRSVRASPDPRHTAGQFLRQVGGDERISRTFQVRVDQVGIGVVVENVGGHGDIRRGAKSKFARGRPAHAISGRHQSGRV